MGATEEQMVLLSANHVSHVSYVLILYSIAFLLFLFVSMLLHLYANSTWPLKPKSVAKSNGVPFKEETDGVNGGVNGGVLGNGHLTNGHLGRVRDAEEFELEGLMSEDDTDEGESMGRKVGRRD